MTSPMGVPVGASDYTAPTGDTHPVAYARGVLQAEADTLRREKDDLLRTVEVLLAALEGGEKWEIDHASHLARRELNHLKDQT